MIINQNGAEENTKPGQIFMNFYFLLLNLIFMEPKNGALHLTSWLGEPFRISSFSFHTFFMLCFFCGCYIHYELLHDFLSLRLLGLFSVLLKSVANTCSSVLKMSSQSISECDMTFTLARVMTSKRRYKNIK